MAIQGTGTPPKTKRSGIFPDSIRKTVIISSVIIFLIMGVLGGVGIRQNWDIFYNLISLIIAVGSAVIGLLALWPSKGSAEAGTHASDPSTQQAPQSPVQVIINNNPGYTGGVLPANPPSSPSTTPGSQQQRVEPSTESAGVVSQQPSVEDQAPQHLPLSTLSTQTDEENGDADNLLRALIQCSPSIFDAVIAYYNPPSGVGETGTRANRARELVNTATDRGDLSKLINAYYKAMGIKPSAKKSSGRTAQ